MKMMRMAGTATSSFSRIVLVIGLLLAAVGIGAGGMAIVNAQDGDEKIVACVDEKSGALRILAPKQACLEGEYKLVWNVQGPASASFNGSYVSPNGHYSLSVRDSGILLNGPSGGVTVNNAGVTVNAVTVTLQGSGQTRISGSTVTLNCPNGGLPVARVSDVIVVNGPTGQIVNGSPTVSAC